MKKYILLSLFTLIALGCSSSGDSSSSGLVYFNFTCNDKDYSTSFIEEESLCHTAEVSSDNLKVNFLMNYKSPADNVDYCGVSISDVNNSISTSNGCSFSLVYTGLGGEGISSDNVTVVLTSVGNYYIGTFSGDFQITNIATQTTVTKNGSGSFKAKKNI
jgi:hypothetical protein